MHGRSGLPVGLKYYRGQVLLIVNVASQCGYTDFTYGKLNALHDKYASRGLRILAFPCNQFGQQEPGTADDIYAFAHDKKKVAFDLFRKVDVGGPTAHPLFKWLLGAGGDCFDENASCPSWAESGECEKNEAFMRTGCMRSCGFCTVADLPSAVFRAQCVRQRARIDSFSLLSPSPLPASSAASVELFAVPCC